MRGSTRPSMHNQFSERAVHNEVMDVGTHLFSPYTRDFDMRLVAGHKPPSAQEHWGEGS